MTLVLAIRLVAAAAALTLQGFPPNLVENGDARGGPSGWQPVPGHQRPRKDLSRDAMIEMVDGAPCFVMRNQASWVQRLPLYEDHAGKFLLIIGRGSSERVYEDDNITGLPYLWAHLVADESRRTRTGCKAWPCGPRPPTSGRRCTESSRCRRASARSR